MNKTALYCGENQQVMLVEPSNTTSELHNIKIQVKHPIEISNEYVFDISKANKANAKKKTKKEKKAKKKTKKKENEIVLVDWRKQYCQGLSRERTEHNADSVNRQVVSKASKKELSSVIRGRGTNMSLLAIKEFLSSIPLIFIFSSQNLFL